MKGYSIETTPNSATKLWDSGRGFNDVLPEGTKVNVTFLPGTDFAQTIDTCARLSQEQMVPVPHIAARSVRDVPQLSGYLAELTERAQLREVLVIAGGVDDGKEAGSLKDSMQILDSGVLQRHGITHIGLAAHPQGCPAISNKDVLDAMRRKSEWAAAARADGISCYFETQFCFDAQPVIEWDKRIRDEQITLPVRVGVAGPASLRSLVTYAAMAGVQLSARMASQQTGQMARLLTSTMSGVAPDGLIVGLAQYMAESECGLEGLHFYSFGGISKTAAWANAAANGQFDVHGDGSGFTVHS